MFYAILPRQMLTNITNTNNQRATWKPSEVTHEPSRLWVWLPDMTAANKEPLKKGLEWIRRYTFGLWKGFYKRKVQPCQEIQDVYFKMRRVVASTRFVPYKHVESAQPWYDITMATKFICMYIVWLSTSEATVKKYLRFSLFWLSKA